MPRYAGCRGLCSALRWAACTGNLGAVLVLYYDELGLPKTHIGLLNALIFLPGPLALFVAPLAARWGFKRTYLTFYSTRKVVFALLASPFVLHQTG